ncbi:MAG: class I SAM-dependent methyltransferase [Gemmatimonadaceae bacterium]|nr:class I SAM-dependent methyltransferase [Gemmatimonadaceae bacterium]
MSADAGRDASSTASSTASSNASPNAIPSAHPNVSTPVTPPARDPGIVVDRQYGRTAIPYGWVPAPRFLLRRDRVLARLRQVPPGRVIEMGCGAASLLADLAAMGWSGAAVETSAHARTIASHMLADLPQMGLYEHPDPAWEGSFDLLMAFEVLEHIEDDVGVLTAWMRYLRPGGRVLLSVPAHAHRWTATDTFAGHVRRYDRRDFVALGEKAGARVVSCDNYGYPLANVVEPIKSWTHAKELSSVEPRKRPARTPEEIAARDARTSESGVHRDAEVRVFPLMTSLPGRLAMRACCHVQTWFTRSELGTGFLLEAVKP